MVQADSVPLPGLGLLELDTPHGGTSSRGRYPRFTSSTRTIQRAPPASSATNFPYRSDDARPITNQTIRPPLPRSCIPITISPRRAEKKQSSTKTSSLRCGHHGVSIAHHHNSRCHNRSGYGREQRSPDLRPNNHLTGCATGIGMSISRTP